MLKADDRLARKLSVLVGFWCWAEAQSEAGSVFALGI